VESKNATPRQSEEEQAHAVVYRFLRGWESPTMSMQPKDVHALLVLTLPLQAPIEVQIMCRWARQTSQPLFWNDGTIPIKCTQVH
jgi:hypothetical protein